MSVIKFLHGSVVTQTMLGTVRPVVNFVQCSICAKKYEKWMPA